MFTAKITAAVINWGWGADLALSIERLTLDFGSGHDLMVREMEPYVRLHADGLDPAWDSLSAPCPLALSLSLSLTKQNKAKQNKTIKLN